MPPFLFFPQRRPSARLRTVAAGLLSFLLVVGEQRAQTAPNPNAPRPAKTRTDLPNVRPEDLVTVHYHRRDGNYQDVNVWTWDLRQKKTPEHNEPSLVGHDDFGPVFQLDRARYDGSDKIGLITRLGHDWSHKDGGDKVWSAALGGEVWLVSGKDEVFARPPDLSPHVENAWIDARDTVVVSLTDQLRMPVSVTILDQQNGAHAARSVVPDETQGKSASFKLTVQTQGALDVAHDHYRVKVDGFGPPVPLVPRGVLDDRDLFFDADARLGAACTAQATTFRLFAPTATAVSVVLYDRATGSLGRSVRPLRPCPKGLWEETISGDLRGKFYVYVLEGPQLDPAHEVLDPYAVNAVASGTRGRLTELTGPPAPGPALASPTDMVIYETHVRDFTMNPDSGVRNRGLFLGFTEPGTRLPDQPDIRTALDNLSELGVTHVELLPTQDYANDETHPKFDWGYIPTAYFSPEGLYATNPDDDSRVREFKALVEALHARGIGVIMDVVFNHTDPAGPFDTTVPGYYYRHLPDGSLANGSACGNEFRTEAPMARKLILDSLAFWTREYGVDGYRFDFMSLVDQETMRQAEKTLRAIRPDIVLYGEPWTARGTPLRDQSDTGAIKGLPVGAFNDSFRRALDGTPKGQDPGFIQNGSTREALKKALAISDWLASPAQSINYLSCHDDLVLWDKLAISMPGANDLMMAEAMKLGFLVLFTSQGVPFFQGGDEFARTKGGNDNSYNAPDSVNNFDWSLKPKHLDLFAYARDLINLRKAHPAFRLRTREEVAARLKFAPSTGNRTLVYTLDASGVPGEAWKRICVVLNSDDSADTEVALPEGQWTVAFDERGFASKRTAVGKVNVRHKSGVVLFQP